MVRAYKEKAWFPSPQLKHAPSSFPLCRGLHRTSPPQFLPREDQLTWPVQHHASPISLPTQVLWPAAPQPPFSSSQTSSSPIPSHRPPSSLSPPPKDTHTSIRRPLHTCQLKPSALTIAIFPTISSQPPSNTFLPRPAATLPYKAPPRSTATLT